MDIFSVSLSLGRGFEKTKHDDEIIVLCYTYIILQDVNEGFSALGLHIIIPVF